MIYNVGLITAVEQSESVIHTCTHIYIIFWSYSFPLWFACVHAKSLQSCLTLCDSMDCSPPGSSLSMEILQARILGWVAMPSSRGSPRPRDQTRHCLYLLHWQACSSPSEPPGKPMVSSPTAYFPCYGPHRAPLWTTRGSWHGRKGLWDQEWLEQVWGP